MLKQCNSQSAGNTVTNGIPLGFKVNGACFSVIWGLFYFRHHILQKCVCEWWWWGGLHMNIKIHNDLFGEMSILQVPHNHGRWSETETRQWFISVSLWHQRRSTRFCWDKRKVSQADNLESPKSIHSKSNQLCCIVQDWSILLSPWQQCFLASWNDRLRTSTYLTVASFPRKEKWWRTTVSWVSERNDLCSVAFWEEVLLSGLSGWQDEAKDHHRSATETADVEHLLFPFVIHLSLSLSAFRRAHSDRLSASTLDLISLSLSLRCYGNQNLGTLVLWCCNGSCIFMLWPEIPSQLRLLCTRGARSAPHWCLEMQHENMTSNSGSAPVLPELLWQTGLKHHVWLVSVSIKDFKLHLSLDPEQVLNS